MAAQSSSRSGIPSNVAQKLRPTPMGLAAAWVRKRRLQRAWIGALVLSAGAVGTVFQSCSGSSAGLGTGSALRDGANGDRPLIGAGERAAQKSEKPGATVMDENAKNLEALFAKMNQNDQPARASAAEESDEAVGERVPIVGKTSVGGVGGKGSDRALGSEGAKSTATVMGTEKEFGRGGSGGGSGANVPASLDEPMVGPIAMQDVAERDGEVANAKTVEVRRAELASELVALLRPSRVDGSDTVASIAPLLALETVQPGAAGAEIESAIKLLSPDEAAAVRAVRELLHKLGTDPNLAADPQALAKELLRQVDHLAATAPTEGISLGTMALCSRVESFGRYTPLASSRMVAGRTNSAIMYVEVSNFVQRPSYEARLGGVLVGASDADSVVVQLSQEIELWHDDGSRQLRLPTATITDVSRTARHDFFLVQRVDLPPNLSVGKYNLKVTVRDTGAEGSPRAEAMIPIEIVADPTLLGGSKTPMTKQEPRRIVPERAKNTTQRLPAASSPAVVRPVKRASSEK